MDKYIIYGGKPLKGEVTISGAKNAALAIIPATLLSSGICRIENIPDVSDAAVLLRTLYELGAIVKRVDFSTYEIDCRPVKTYEVPYELTKPLRASCYFYGAMLGRFGNGVVAPSGGCDIGSRPIDLHKKGLCALGAEISEENGSLHLKADRLVGSSVYLDNPSVGATVNIILAAVKSKGLTVIENAAREPHIVDLANFLNSMGADIFGAGTDLIKIHGVKALSGTNYSIIPDQIEAGTYMVMSAATKGNVLIKNVIPKHLESISAKLEEMGVQIDEYDDSIRVRRKGELLKCNVKTLAHPGFPTDMQAQITTLLSVANGTSMVSESIFENRFRYTDELCKMGADITVNGRVAVVEGVEKLHSAKVKAFDLRAGAAMIIAGLMCEGATEISDVKYIERGYENIVSKIRGLGADIRRIQISAAI